jgi:methionyl-tRNA formyltransferase
VRLVFAGTPEFSRVALEHLHAAGHEIALVLTQPDRPAGRGMKLHASSVKQFALEKGLPVVQPRSLRLDGKYPDDAAAAREALQAAKAEAMVVAAYGLILPQWVLDTPARGCFNIHASILPRWRGAAPIQRAIEAGDAETGVTIMQMDAGLDTGDMLLAHTTEILASDTTGSLQDRLAVLGARLMLLALEVAAVNALKPIAQQAAGVTYAHKIDKTEAAIDWSQAAAQIARRVRAFNPAPGASATLQGEILKVWHAEALAHPAPAGVAAGGIVAVSAEGIVVAALDSMLLITELQRPGGKRLNVADFLRGFDLRPGMAFEMSPR